MQPREFLKGLFDAAVKSADPARLVRAFLPPVPKGRTLVLGAGKASAIMAKAAEEHWKGPLSGLVITRYGHAAPCQNIEIVEAGHPVPDEAGQAATTRLLSYLTRLSPDDLVLCLISGGGSSLLVQPAGDVTLAEKRALTQALLAAGADIHEINCVRKHLSAVKGGRLARAALPARVHALILSDVAGDDLSVVASGPTAPDPTTQTQARAVLARYGVDISPQAAKILADPLWETPASNDPAFLRVTNEIIGSGALSLQVAAKAAEAAGVRAISLGDAITGEARAVALAQADMARAQVGRGPVVILSGGETTVRVHGGGKGGRNSEFALALALALDGAPNIWALACDTDGIDGSGDNAGALIAPDSLARARAAGIDPTRALASNDSYSVFERTNDLVRTGPTRTNVNDFRAVFIAT